MRACYERKKRNYLEEQIRLANEKRVNKMIKIKKIEISDVVKVLKENSLELRKTVRNKIDSGSAMVIARKVYPDITENKVNSACKELLLIPKFIDKIKGGES
jgi:hypothetical protein